MNMIKDNQSNNKKTKLKKNSKEDIYKYYGYNRMDFSSFVR